MVSVQNIIDSPELHLIGHYIPSPEAPARWTAASELVDPTPYLEGGELLLTTGGNTLGWSTQWHEYLRRLSQSGVVAIGLGTGLTYPSIPPELLAACRRYEVNLIEVPAETTFVSITQHTARMLFQGEQAQAHETLMVQRDLALTALDRDDPSELLHTLSEIIRGGAGLLSAEGDFTAGPYGIEMRDEVATFGQRIRQMRPRGLRTAASSSGPGGTSLIQPIGLSGRPEFYLAIWSKRPLSDVQYGAVSTAATLLSLAAESQHDRLETNRRLRSQATELILTGDVHTAAVLLATVAGGEQSANILPPSAQVLALSGKDDDLDEVMAALENSRPAEDRPLLASRRDGLHIVASPAMVPTILSNTNDLQIRIGIGSQQGPQWLQRSRTQADLALEQTTASSPVTYWDELLAAGAIALMKEDAATEFSRSFLQPIKGRPELKATLWAFLRHHGASGMAAKELGVHRNTVRHRLAEIESLLGYGLDDEQVRVNAWIALQIDATQFR